MIFIKLTLHLHYFDKHKQKEKREKVFEQHTNIDIEISRKSW